MELKVLKSEKFLVWLCMTWLLLIIVGWLSISGVAREMGFNIFGFSLSDEDRAARIIMLYHSLAIPVVAVIVYFILDLFNIKDPYHNHIKWSITVGYFLTSIGGLYFGYFDLNNMWAHWIFLMGLFLAFYSGVLLFLATIPSKYSTEAEPKLLKMDLWYVNLFILSAYSLLSAIVGGVIGIYLGSDFDAFLVEDIVRETSHSLFELAVIGHLHTMLILIDVSVLLIVARYIGIEEKFAKGFLYLVLIGTSIAILGTWLVMIINVYAYNIVSIIGIFMLLFAAGVFAIHGWSKIIYEKQGQASEKISLSVLQKIKALLSDSVKFGLFFQFLLVNVVVVIPGLYVALNLDLFRSEGMLVTERAFLVGHWHVLATLTVVIGAYLVTDYLDIRGIFRMAIGWLLFFGSILAFLFIQFYIFNDPNPEAHWALLYVDLGNIMILDAIVLIVYLGFLNFLSKLRGK